MSKTISRPDDKAVESIIGMQFAPNVWRFGSQACLRRRRYHEFDIDKMAGNLLSRSHTRCETIILKKAATGLIGAADLQNAPLKFQYCQLIKPFTGVNRVKRFNAVKNIQENICRALCCQIQSFSSRVLTLKILRYAAGTSLWW